MEPGERALLLKTFVQRVVYTPDRLQIFLFNDPLDEKALKEAREALRGTRSHLLSASGVRGFLNRPVWAAEDSNL